MNKTIEVEKKFLLTGKEIEKVIQDAEFLSEKSFTDVYFDTAGYSLTITDTWLRLRDDTYELKLPMNEGKGSSQRVLDQYEELDTDEAIKKALGLPSKHTLKEDLAVNGYIPFSKITTTRRKYKKGEFIIDLDTLDFGYTIGEIELMVNEKAEIELALNKILALAKEWELSVAPVRGKVIEYIRRNNPAHYEALIEAGVI